MSQNSNDITSLPTGSDDSLLTQTGIVGTPNNAPPQAKWHNAAGAFLQDTRRFEKIIKNILKILIPILLFCIYFYLFEKMKSKIMQINYGR